MKVVNGHIISGTSICVDYWLWTPEEKYHHFLTHLHADHTVNLKSTFREKIYTSPFNAWLLRRWFNISSECIVALNVGDTHLVYDPNSQSRFSVTLLDANHCPGSVMFLFQGEFGNILYTGDFRYNPNIFKHPMLKSLIENEAVDRLYLDNTFAAEHCEFPPRQEALKDVINIVKDHPDHNILIGVRKLGKEEVLRAIALELKEKICVSDEKLRILAKLGYESVFTTDSEDSRIFVKEMPHITPRSINQLRAARGPVVTILLTALYSVVPPHTKYCIISADTDKGIYKIPYSDHSCHSELVEFVSKIKPKEIFPIVSSSAGHKANSSRSDELSEILSCTWQNSVIPKSIMKFSGIPENWGVVSIPVSKSSFVSGFKENVVSYMTDNNSETSWKNVIGTPKGDRASKAQMQENSKDQIDENESGTRTENESPEIISKQNHSPTVSISQTKNQEVPLNSINSGSKIALINPEASEEYFTMSDEDLSQLNIASDRPNIISKLNLTCKEVLGKDSDVIVKSVQTAGKGNEDSQSNHLCSDLINSHQLLENQVSREKHVNFTPCTPPSTHKCKFFKKRLPTPIPKAKYTNIEQEDEENESYGSINSDVQSDVIMKSVQTVGEDNEASQSNNLCPDLINSHHILENQVSREKHVNFIPCTPPLSHKCKFFKKRLPTPIPKKKYTNIEEENDEENESYGSINSDVLNDVIKKNVQTAGEGNEDSQSNNLCSDLINSHHLLKNQVSREKHVNFTPFTPPLTHKSKFFKKHFATPIPEAEYTYIEEENDENEENESYGSINADVQSEESNDSELHRLVKLIVGSDVETNRNRLHPTQSSGYDFKNHQNLAASEDFQDFNLPIPVKEKATFFTKHPPTQEPQENHTNMEEEDEESKSNDVEKLDTLRETNFTCDIVKSKKTYMNSQRLAKNVITMTEKNIKINKSAQFDAGKQVMFTFSSPVQQNRSKMFKNHLPTPKTTKKLVTEENVDKENNSVTPIKMFQDKHFLKNNNNNCHLKTINILPDASSKNNISDKKQVMSNRKALAGKSKLLEESSPRLMSTSTNQSYDCHKNYCLQNRSSATKDSIGSTSTIKDRNQFDEDEKRKNDIRASILKRIFQPQSTAKQNVENNFHTKGCLQNTSSSVPKVSVGVSSVSNVEYQFEDEIIKNDIRASILKRIFQPQLTTAKQNVEKNGHANDSFQNTSSSVGKVPTRATSIVKVGNQFDEDEKRKNDKRASTLRHIFHTQSPITNRDVIGETDNSSSSDSDISVQMTKPKRKKKHEPKRKKKHEPKRKKKHNDDQSEQGGSESTVSDLEDNGVTLEKFEILDRRNDQICLSGKNDPSTSKDTRISEKFEHLLVKSFQKRSSGSGFFPPGPTSKQNNTSMNVSSLAQNNNVLLQRNNCQSCLNKKRNEDKCSLIESTNCLQENNQNRQRVPELKGNKKRNHLERYSCISHNKHDRQSISDIKEFGGYYCETLSNIYESWKEAVRKASEEQKVGFQQTDKNGIINH